MPLSFAYRRIGWRANEGGTVDAVLLEKDGPVARLILNRPEKHNALRFADLDQLVELLHEAEEDDDVRVIVLQGRGRSFCSGHDYNDAAASYGLEAGADGTKPRRPSQRSRLLQDRRGGGYSLGLFLRRRHV